jgi:small subunit ribosomal protein S8
LYKEELIYDFHVDKANNKIQIKLKYFKDKPILTSLNLISKPSLIVFSNFTNLKKFSNNYDFFFISTSNGVISSAFAKKNLNVGGIVLFGLKLNI